MRKMLVRSTLAFSGVLTLGVMAIATPATATSNVVC